MDVTSHGTMVLITRLPAANPERISPWRAQRSRSTGGEKVTFLQSLGDEPRLLARLVAQALLPVPRTDAFYAWRTGCHRAPRLFLTTSTVHYPLSTAFGSNRIEVCPQEPRQSKCTGNPRRYAEPSAGEIFTVSNLSFLIWDIVRQSALPHIKSVIFKFHPCSYPSSFQICHFQICDSSPAPARHLEA